MNYDQYLKYFEQAARLVNRKSMDDNNLSLYTGIVLESSVIKVYKPEWSGDKNNPLTATTRIFFAVWINDKTIEEGRLYYNIHALKLRLLKGYTITSRKFADDFRSRLLKQKQGWPNLDLNYGPLTLMQGWQILNMETLAADIAALVDRFITVSPAIDKTLASFKNLQTT